MDKVFYAGRCPVCRSYGRLEFDKDVTNDECIIICEECFAEWKNPQDAIRNINGRRCTVKEKVRRATFHEIKALGWDKFIVEDGEEGI